MNNVELTEKELVTLLELVRSAKDEVYESLDCRDEDGDSNIGDFALSMF